jgi:hypothetical protein
MIKPETSIDRTERKKNYRFMPLMPEPSTRTRRSSESSERTCGRVIASAIASSPSQDICMKLNIDAYVLCSYAGIEPSSNSPGKFLPNLSLANSRQLQISAIPIIRQIGRKCTVTAALSISHSSVAELSLAESCFRTISQGFS